jgi:hypothetical protein
LYEIWLRQAKVVQKKAMFRKEALKLNQAMCAGEAGKRNHNKVDGERVARSIKNIQCDPLREGLRKAIAAVLGCGGTK